MSLEPNAIFVGDNSELEEEVEEDDDNISITSSIQSEEQDEYLLESILDEKNIEESDEHGNITTEPKYLIRWLGYPLHRSTWEPVSHFREGRDDTVNAWHDKRERQLQGLEPVFDRETFEADQERRINEVNHRIAKRERKRARLSRQYEQSLLLMNKRNITEVESDGEDSDFDVPLAALHTKTRESSAAKRRKLVSSPLHDHAETNDLDIPTRPKTTATTTTATLSKPVLKRTTLFDTLDIRKEKKPEAQITAQLPTTKPFVSPLGPAVPIVPLGPAIFDAPAQKSSKALVKDITEVSNSISLSLSARNRLQRAVRNTHAPRVNDLMFVDTSKPDRSTTTRITTAEAAEMPSADERVTSPYNSQALITPDSSSVVPAKTSLTKRPDINRSYAEVEISQPEQNANFPLLTCWFWANSQPCREGATCTFEHYHTGTVNFDRNQLAKVHGTCWFWYVKKFCHKNAEDCFYSHFETRYMSAASGRGSVMKFDQYKRLSTETRPNLRPPLSTAETLASNTPLTHERLSKTDLGCYFHHLTPQGCIKTDRECQFAHHMTEWIAGRGLGSATLISGGKSKFAKSESDENFYNNVSDSSSSAKQSARDATSSNVVLQSATAPVSPGLSRSTSHTTISNDSAYAGLDRRLQPIFAMPGKASALVEKVAFLEIPSSYRKQLSRMTALLEGSAIRIYNSDVGGLCLKQFRENHRSGVIIFHTDFREFHKIEQLTHLLDISSVKFNVFRITNSQVDEQEMFDFVRIFPHGQAVYLMDKCITDQAKETLQVVKLLQVHMMKRPTNDVRILGRPELKSWLLRQVHEQDDSDVAEILRILCAQLSLFNNKPPGPYGTDEPLPESPVYFSSEACLPQFAALQDSAPVKADSMMAEWFAGWAIAHVKEIRRFVILTPRHTDITEKWKRDFKHISIMTPAEYIVSDKQRKGGTK